MYSVLIGALLNIVLDPIFIFLARYGSKGAALATVLSQACSAVWVLTFLFLPARLSPFRKTLHGVEPGNNTFYICFGRITVYYGKYRKPGWVFVLNSSLKDFGDIYVSALTILQSAMQFASVPLTGFAQGVRSYCEL